MRASRGRTPTSTRTPCATPSDLLRTVRVVPDVTAVERVFDYLVPDALDARVTVGTIVRVPLHGRRVRGWVIDDDVDAATSDTPTEKLLPIREVVSAGPPPDVVALTEWVATTWCGPRVAVLRSASPPNRVDVESPPRAVAAAVPAVAAENDVERAADALVRDAGDAARAVIAWPPLLDRRRIVDALIAGEGSVIVAVADASRAGALVAHLRRAGRRAVLMHSDLSAAERTRAWNDARRGECVVVGGRIVAFAPVPDLASVVVVDDADEALQEERVPTWHARDVLAERARHAGARFTVVSAVPTTQAVVSYAALRRPPHDVERAGWPRLEIVDRREEPPGSGLYSDPLAIALRSARDGGDLAICVLNRRGRARLLACATCGQLTRWDRTGAPLWSARDDRARTGEPEARPNICPHCGSTRLRQLRAGVTRVREELSALLGGAAVAEVDASTDVVEDAAVVVGTEAVLHRVEIRRRRPVLVAYLDFDAELFAPRYRAAEQALWLLVRGAQLLGRRPRGETRLLVQTRQPEHEVLLAVRDADPGVAIAAERARREALSLPPFGALAELTGEAAPCDAAIDALRTLDQRAAGVTVLGPLAEGRDVRALVRAPDGATLAAALAAAVPAARTRGRLRVAVDPPRV